MSAAIASIARRSGSVLPLGVIIGSTVLTAGYWGGSWLPTAGRPAERAFAPIQHPWEVKDERDATNKHRVARYKYLYRDQATGEVKAAPPAVTSGVVPVKNLPSQLLVAYPPDRYDGDA